MSSKTLVILLTSLVSLLLIIGYLSNNKNKTATSTSTIALQNPLNSALVKPTTTSLKTPTKLPPNTIQKKINNTYNLQALQTLPLQQLKNEIENFWRHCQKQQQNNCDKLLEELETLITEERWEIISEYPEKKQQLQQLLTNNLNQHNLDINTKIAQLKASHYTLWGETAEKLFAEEYSYYNNYAELQQLNQLNQWANTEEKLHTFDQWLLQHSHQQSNPQLQTGLNKYHYAQVFFEKELQTDSGLQTTLAQHYLNPEQVQEEESRQQRRQNQQQQAENYQQALQSLRRKLDNQHQTELRYLSDTEWQNYQEQQIERFRLDFFTE